MKEMAALQPGMSFYGELPDSYNMIVNVEHPVVARVKAAAYDALSNEVKPLLEKIDANTAQISKIRDDAKGEKLSDEAHKLVDTLEAEVNDARKSMNDAISNYAKTQPLVKQLIDLALLGNGLLKGQQLSEFITRSVQLL
jgi:molecular chaperone HtpG